jgi:hypothetical protein
MLVNRHTVNGSSTGCQYYLVIMSVLPNMDLFWKSFLCWSIMLLWYVLSLFQQYFSRIVMVSFIGEETRENHLLTFETGYWSIFIYVYMTGCVKCHVYFSTFVLANESWLFLCRVLSFIFYWFGMVRLKLTIPERWQAVGMYNGGFSHRRVVADDLDVV